MAPERNITTDATPCIEIPGPEGPNNPGEKDGFDPVEEAWFNSPPRTRPAGDLPSRRQ